MLPAMRIVGRLVDSNAAGGAVPFERNGRGSNASARCASGSRIKRRAPRSFRTAGCFFCWTHSRSHRGGRSRGS